jgi:hypothetical protein
MNESVRLRGVGLVWLLCSTAAMAGEAVPLYPHTHQRGTAQAPIDEQATARAIEQGVTLSIYTSDSTETVDGWYTKMLPKTCVRTQIEDTHIYRHVCATRTVNISPSQGQTSINIGPNQ